MSKPKRLIVGVHAPAVPPEVTEQRIEVLRATVEKYLPQFVLAVAKSEASTEGERADTVLLHQDAFAAGYDDDEYTLLGMAVKYAGLHGITVTVHGRNHETF